MRKTEFIKAMKDYAKSYGKVVVDTVERPDKKYTGLRVERGIGVPTPIVNLDNLYRDYKDEALSLDDCFDTMRRILEMKQEVDITVVTDWNKAKDRLFIRLFGSITEGIVYHKVEDLYLVPYIQISDDGSSMTKVTSKLLELWGVDENMVFDTAEENQEIIRPLKMMSIYERMGIPEDTSSPIYMVSTTNETCGASAIFYEGVADTLYEKMGGEFYILPSSIHEVLIVPKTSGKDIKRLKEMVTVINAGEVEEEDRLTNSVYSYDFENRRIVKVSK